MRKVGWSGSTVELGSRGALSLGGRGTLSDRKIGAECSH